MKSIIIYYSYTGNTKRVVQILAEVLKENTEVEIVRLADLNETGKFFIQASRALRHTKTNIGEVNLDLSGYDLICFGTPVWAFAPVPAINTYLDKCFGLQGKRVILFTTYGSGTGNRHCLNYMQKILNKKGVKNFRCFSIQQFKTKDKDFVLSEIRKIMRL